MIETQESPSLQADLGYILDTSVKKTIFGGLVEIARKPSRLVSDVKTEYYLTYHQKKPDEMKTPKRKKQVKRYIGDEILQVIRFSEVTIDPHLLLCITDFEVGGTKHSKEFLQNEGFIPVERFIGDKNPKWIIIGAGSTAMIQEGESFNDKYLIIPGKINFRFYDRYGLHRYSHRLSTPMEFLKKHPKLRKMARENNVEPTILTAEKILVLERIDTSWGDISRTFFKALRGHRDIGLTLGGAYLFNLGIGIQQGTIISPILHMLDSFGLLVAITWIMQYIYPNIVYSTSVITSAVRFDRIKSAEKDEIVERATINIEFKKVLRNAAVFSMMSSALLIVIFPGFFVGSFLSIPLVRVFIAIVYILSAFFRDWPINYEQDALFRILKRSLSDDSDLYASILKINALASSGEIIFNFAGIAIGWIAMSVSKDLGITLSILGAIAAIAKLLYPYYGEDYSIAFFSTSVPFYSSEHEIVERATINIELKKVLRNAAVYSMMSSALL